MSTLFIGSTGNHAGQSLVACSIANRMMERGYRVGAIKPFGTALKNIDGNWIDPDALLYKEIFKMEEPLDMICPNLFPENWEKHQEPAYILENIKSRSKELSEGKDLLIMIGSKHIYYDDVPHLVPDISLISDLDADLILTHSYDKISTTIYSILSVNSLIKGRVKAVVINRIPPGQIDEIQGHIMPSLSNKGIANITFLTEDRKLSMRSIGEINDILGGRIICGREYVDRPVERMTVGTMGLHKDLLLFKRVYNKIILLAPSGERVAEELQPPEKTAGIILTGNREPNDLIIETANKSKIPLLLVKEDSFAAQERLDQNVSGLSFKDGRKISYFMDMLDQDDFLNKIIRSIGFII